jgi:hypothetical protein
MKTTLFFVTCSLLFLISCDKLFVGVSGKEVDLQGKWQMDNADTVYYNFQNNLFMYQIYQTKGNMSMIYGYYTLYGDTAIDLRLLSEYANGISLDYLGWDTLHSATGQDTIFKAFKIDELTNKKLTLHSNNGKESFHKF